MRSLVLVAVPLSLLHGLPPTKTSASMTTATWLGYPEPIDVASIPRISVDDVAAAQLTEELLLVDVRRSDLTVSLRAQPSFPDMLQEAQSLTE